jgi:hypothetical protein
MDSRYPIGRLEPASALSPEARRADIDTIAGLPAALRAAVDGLGMLTVDSLVRTYAWHSRPHTAHVTSLRERMGWH